MLLKFEVICVALLFICSSSLAFSLPESSEGKTARERVDHYKSLRRACAITQGTPRQECFKQLNAATQDYKKAKKELAMEQPIQAQGPVLGQAQ